MSRQVPELSERANMQHARGQPYPTRPDPGVSHQVCKGVTLGNRFTGAGMRERGDAEGDASDPDDQVPSWAESPADDAAGELRSGHHTDR
jgi:hypothetical protein